MQKVETKENLIWLKDFYAPLLTGKQQEVLNLYLDGDYTFTEIAEEMGSTKQAVYDMVRRSEKLLLAYEKKLGLLSRFQAVRQKAEYAEKLVWALPGTDEQKQEMIRTLDDILEVL